MTYSRLVSALTNQRPVICDLRFVDWNVIVPLFLCSACLRWVYHRLGILRHATCGGETAEIVFFLNPVSDGLEAGFFSLIPN